MAATKKTKNDIKLSDELSKVVEDLASSRAGQGSVTEDEIQVAIRDIDVDSDELSDLYEALRVKGLEVTSAEVAEQGFSSDDDDVVDDDFDDVPSDEFSDEEGEESESAAEAKAVKEALRSVPKARAAKPKRSSRARARRQDTSTVMLTGDPVRMYL